jgi:hypothetical protein
MLSPATWYQSLPLGALVGGCFYLFLLGLIHADLRGDLMQTNRILAGIDINKLQATLDEDFFTKLVKINFKYIDQYYLQTQSQADKSFRLSAAVAIVGLLIVIAGIVLMFLGRTTPAYVTVSSGVLGEFIAAVFFYLYNQTILKMGDYHQKLVLTQNVGLALKIAETLPEGQRTQAQRELIQRLTENVNRHLTQIPPKYSSRRHPRLR